MDHKEPLELPRKLLSVAGFTSISTENLKNVNSEDSGLQGSMLLQEKEAIATMY